MRYRITTTLQGAFVKVRAECVPGPHLIERRAAKIASWKVSAFRAGDDGALISNRAAARMAKHLGAAPGSLWVGTRLDSTCAVYRQADDSRLHFFVAAS